jgi:hypothetical protein
MTTLLRLVLCILAAVVFCSPSLLAQTPRLNAILPTTNDITARSVSQQFIIHGKRLLNRSVAPLSGTGVNLIRLDPSLLAVTCERVKTEVLRELDAPDHWQGKIHVTIQNVADPRRPIDIRTEHFSNGWQYHVYVPESATPERLIRGLTEVVLLEIANREGQPHMAELPLWLNEGFTGLLLSHGGTDLVLRPESRTTRREMPGDPFRSVREYLAHHPTFTITQLGLPTPDLLNGESWQTYQASSQWLVIELLRMPEGRARLRLFLSLLPRNLNWQLGFLTAFNPQFNSLLDLEKWWAMCLLDTRGRDQWQGWSRQASWDKLHAVIHLPAQETPKPGATASWSEVTLQQVIEWWDYQNQKAILNSVLQKLHILGINSSPEIVPLVQEYQQALSTYLDQRSKAGYEGEGRSRQSFNANLVTKNVITRLNGLDAQLEAFRQNTSTTTSAPSPARRSR